jgi:hypothetical protein
MNKINYYRDLPEILTFANLNVNMIISKKIKIKMENLHDATYYLKGIIYHGRFHFNSHIITTDKKVWFHDGMSYGSNCIYEGNLSEYLSNDLLKRTQYKSCLLLYSKNT